MSGYIQSIKTIIPYTDKIVNIDLRGKNLILTGGNGCGKTNLLNHLFDYLKRRVIDHKNYDTVKLQASIENFSTAISAEGKKSPSYEDWSMQMKIAQEKLDEIQRATLSFVNLEMYIDNFYLNRALLTTFKAVREANISESTSALSTSTLVAQVNGKRQTLVAGSLFEQYLVSYKTVQAYADAPSVNNTPDIALKIQTWFNELESNLKILFEDPSLVLQFDSRLQTFLIKQEHKEAYRFQQLSSGYSSILAVYAHLVTTVQLDEVTPNEIEGVVFIDEIDAHLHVSLQRKIFSFLVNSFPKVQFIVSTHSPFVVSSVSDAVIYDLSKLEQIEDLSMYSYESILEGLFGVSVSSDILNTKIEELHEEAEKTEIDVEKLEHLISELRLNETRLSTESLLFLESAQLSLLKAKARDRNV
ncbi:ATP-binding protein [Undibacterium seohonense]|uniref:ATP-binding protein n=1 Tax=Undibacterium seohonense TaxID=1344950 RepID=A0ABR6X1K2_9BURK|nr:AAA family ATPase [Undibacterium seohonense]MBC3806823.1 ATP-binding protein [Undibacterium seohonense]